MKIKNIMFSGFAAAIFAGVCGAASAATTYELTSKSYVDNKFTAEATRSDSYADQAEADAIATAAEALAGYKTANDAAVKENKDAITAMDTAYKAADAKVLEDANKYTDDEIAELNQSLSGTSTNLGALTERVTTAEGEIDALQAADTAIRGEFVAADAQVLADAKADATTKANAAQAAAAEALAGYKTTNDAAVKENKDAIAALDTAYKAADTAMAEDIADLVAADTAIRGEFADADTALEEAYKAADTTLDGKISAEVSARESADATLDGKITAMDAAYKTADAKVLEDANKYTDDEIDALNQSLSGTTTNLGALTTRVTTAEGEIDALQAADTTLDGKISANAQAIEDEASARETADTTLDGKITALDGAYKAADAQVLADAKADATAKADAVKDFVDAGKFVSANGILTTKGGYLVISDGEGNVSLNQVAVVNGDGTKDIITGNTLQ